MPLLNSTNYVNRFEHPIIPGENPKDQEYPTQVYTKTFTGLPPNSRATLVDTLSTVRENMGQETALTVATFIVPSSGTYTAVGLRPSIYSLLFSQLEYYKYNHHKFMIGSPSEIQAYRHFRKPLQLDLTVSASGLIGHENPFVDLTWAPKAGGTIASSKVLYSGTGAPDWTIYLETRDSLIRSTRIIPLDPGLDYSFKVQSYNNDGNFSESSIQTQRTISRIPTSGADLNATFGVNVFLEDGTTPTSDATIVTSQGTAAFVASQGNLATISLVADQVAVTDGLGGVTPVTMVDNAILGKVAGGNIGDIAVGGGEMVGRTAAGNLASLAAIDTKTNLSLENVNNSSDLTIMGGNLTGTALYIPASGLMYYQGAAGGVKTTNDVNLITLAELDSTADAKLTGIEANADITDEANVSGAGALMDSELTGIAHVKALNQSLISGATPTFGTLNMSDAADKRFMSDAQETKLDTVEANADITDATNVKAAGAFVDTINISSAFIEGVGVSTLNSYSDASGTYLLTYIYHFVKGANQANIVFRTNCKVVGTSGDIFLEVKDVSGSSQGTSTTNTTIVGQVNASLAISSLSNDGLYELEVSIRRVTSGTFTIKGGALSVTA